MAITEVPSLNSDKGLKLQTVVSLNGKGRAPPDKAM